jgi:hypothetical protein
MAKKIIILITLCFITQNGFSQKAKDFIIGSNLDLIRSDHDGYFEKVQIGAEINYFVVKDFTGTGGVEYWTREGVSAVVGARWYPIPDAFIRFRALLGANDVSLGAGWAKPLTTTWKFEAMGDFYFNGNLTIRAGIAYLFKRSD